MITVPAARCARDQAGRRHTKVDPLRDVVRKWARRQEAAFNSGSQVDPRAGGIKVADWRARYAAAHSGIGSAPRNESLWRVHCAPQWGDWKLNAITRMEAQAWVTGLALTVSQRDGGALSAATVHAIVRVMSSMYRAAVRDQVITSTPFAALALPPVEPQPVFFYEPHEAAALYAAMGAIGDRWRVQAQLGMQVGLRWEEMAGLHGHRVDWLRGRIEVVDVMTRAGIREWPKSRNSHRVVPVPPAVLEGMSALMTDATGPAWCSPRRVGGAVSYANFRNRVVPGGRCRAAVRTASARR